MNSKSQSDTIQITHTWIQDIVVGLSLCPFAARELERSSVRYAVATSVTPEAVLEELIAECLVMDNQKDIETTLLILERGYEDFDEYLMIIDLAEQLLEAQGYEGVYQVASFHPNYQFAGCSVDDSANYTNRSPYPMLHILREASLERAVASHPDPESIPERNINLARDKGAEYFKRYLTKSS